MEVRIWDMRAIDHVLLWHSFIWRNCQHQSDYMNECGVEHKIILQCPQSNLRISSLCRATQRGSHANVIIVLGKGHSCGTSKRADQRENEKSCKLWCRQVHCKPSFSFKHINRFRVRTLKAWHIHPGWFITMSCDMLWRSIQVFSLGIWIMQQTIIKTHNSEQK